MATAEEVAEDGPLYRDAARDSSKDERAGVVMPDCSADVGS